MQRLGQQLFTRAAFAQQQGSGIGRRHFLHHAAHFQHLVAGGHDAVERRHTLLLQQALIFLLELAHLVGAVHDQLQRLGFDGLLVKVVGPQTDCPQRVLLVAVASDHDHLGVGRERQGLLERLEALFDAFRVGGQPQVLQHHGRLMPPQLRERRFPILGDQHFVILEAPAQLTLQPRIVFHHQEFSTLIAQQALRFGAVRATLYENPPRRGV